MFEKLNAQVIEISWTLLIKNHQIFVIFKDAVENWITCIGKVRIRLSVQV